MPKRCILVAGLLIANIQVAAQPARIKHPSGARIHRSEQIMTSNGSGPALVESTDFPPATSDPGPDHAGDGCFWLATGAIDTGDVDAISVTLPFAAASVIVDVDLEDGAGNSMLLALLGQSTTVFNINDGNNANDALCGLGAASDPVGSEQDSAVELLDTPAGAVIEIRVTGNGDFKFQGAHSESFSYDVWVHAVREDTSCATDADCDDRIFCNGDEVCDPTVGCIPGVAPDCEDGVDCTVDRCDVDTDACVYEPDDAACDDRVVCNGDEVCDLTAGCVAGAEPNCDDGVMCTVDRCDVDTDSCVYEPDDAACDDNLYCNGEEVCDAATGCGPGEPPCPTGKICDEYNQACVALFLDIKPGSCENPLNLKSRGFVPMALLSVSDSISEMIDLTTIRLGRLDGVGAAIAPHQGQPGPYTVLEDVGTPALDGSCACHGDVGDGVMDVSMKFDMQKLATQLQLAADTLPDPLELELTGTLLDGSVFSATDCFRLVPPKVDRGGNR